MSKPAIKHRIKIWVVTWPKGTTEEYSQEEGNPPTDYLPITAEPCNLFTYYDSKEKRGIYGAPVAVFTNRKEAYAYEASEGNHFTIRQGWLEVL